MYISKLWKKQNKNDYITFYTQSFDFVFKCRILIVSSGKSAYWMIKLHGDKYNIQPKETKNTEGHRTVVFSMWQI